MTTTMATIVRYFCEFPQTIACALAGNCYKTFPQYNCSTLKRVNFVFHFVVYWVVRCSVIPLCVAVEFLKIFFAMPFECVLCVGMRVW